MKILLDAMHFAYQRIDTVLLHGNLYPQAAGRLTEARDHLADAVAFVLGKTEAQEFLQTPDNYRVLRAAEPHVIPSTDLTLLTESEGGNPPGED
jgi:hypothetical protein